MASSTISINITQEEYDEMGDSTHVRLRKYKNSDGDVVAYVVCHGSEEDCSDLAGLLVVPNCVEYLGDEVLALDEMRPVGYESDGE